LKLIVCVRHLKCIRRKWSRGMDYSWHVQHLLREYGCGPLADLRSIVCAGQLDQDRPTRDSPPTGSKRTRNLLALRLRWFQSSPAQTLSQPLLIDSKMRCTTPQDGNLAKVQKPGRGFLSSHVLRLPLLRGALRRKRVLGQFLVRLHLRHRYAGGPIGACATRLLSRRN